MKTIYTREQLIEKLEIAQLKAQKNEKLYKQILKENKLLKDEISKIKNILKKY